MLNETQAEELYKAYLQDVFRYAMFKLHDKESAEDATSETFLRLLARENLDNVENKKAWAIGVARNVIYEVYREQKAQSPLEVDENEPTDNMEQTPELNAINDELYEVLKQKLDDLDETTSEIIILRTWEELKFSEIAEIVREKESTVKLRYYRGIEKLKELVNKKAKSKKLALLLIPALLGGVAKLGTETEFTATPAFAGSLHNTLQIQTLPKPNLTVNSSQMDTTQPSQSQPTASTAASTPAKTIKWAKVLPIAAAATIVVVILIVGALLLLNAQNNNQSANTASSSSDSASASTDNSTSSSSATSNSSTSSTASLDTTGWYSYVNPTYNFSVKYPQNLQLTTLGSTAAYVTDNAASANIGVYFDVEQDISGYYTMTGKSIASTSTMSFEEYALDRGSIFCAIGTNGCTAVASKASFVSDSGATGLEIYYTYQDNTNHTTRTVGPVYAFDIKAASGNKARILFLQSIVANSVQTIKDMARTVKVGSGRDTTMLYRDYMRTAVASPTGTWTGKDAVSGSLHNYTLTLTVEGDQQTMDNTVYAALSTVNTFVQDNSWTTVSHNVDSNYVSVTVYQNPTNGRKMTVTNSGGGFQIMFEYALTDMVTVK